jgi:hypothetical protein
MTTKMSERALTAAAAGHLAGIDLLADLALS